MKYYTFPRLARNEMQAGLHLWGRKQPSVVAASTIWLVFVGGSSPNTVLSHLSLLAHLRCPNHHSSEELTGQIPALGLLLTSGNFLLLIGARAAIQIAVAPRMRKMFTQR